MTPLIRILIVDDFEPFRRFVRLTLQQREEFNIVDEAVDGLEAVLKAQALQPDLILLDISLPKLSGMAAAEQIRKVAPHTKLLFVSLEASSGVVREAFRLGAYGYLHKTQAQFELEPAIEAVLAGGQFVSSDLDYEPGEKNHRRHEIQFYSDDRVFLESVTDFVSAALKAESAVIVLATDSHRHSLLQELRARGVDIDDAIRRGTYVSFDASEEVSNIMLNRVRFFETLSSAIESSRKASRAKHSRVAILGECCGLLCEGGNADAAIQIENACNDQLEADNVDILCPYPLSAFQQPDDDPVLESICAAHTAVLSR